MVVERSGGADDPCARERAEVSDLADKIMDDENQLDQKDIPEALRRTIEAELPGLRRTLAGAERRLSECEQSAGGRRRAKKRVAKAKKASKAKRQATAKKPATAKGKKSAAKGKKSAAKSKTSVKKAVVKKKKKVKKKR